jgi:hypothetical protein
MFAEMNTSAYTRSSSGLASVPLEAKIAFTVTRISFALAAARSG